MTKRDPKDHGAIADGVTDCSAAIMAAAYADFPNPSTVVFTKGIYFIDGHVDILGHCRFEFDGGTLSIGENATVSLAMNQDVDIKWFGANGLLQTVAGSIEQGSNVVSGVGFNSVYVGTPVAIPHAGADGGTLYARVVQNNSNSELVLDTVAANSASGSIYKADDIALRDAMRCHPGGDRFYRVNIPRGLYGWTKSVDIPHRTAVFGAGREQSYLSQYTDFWDGANGMAMLNYQLGGCHTADLMFVPQGTGAAIWHEGVTNDCLIESCWFSGGTGGHPLPMVGGVSNNTNISLCVFEQNDYGLSIEGNYMTVSECIFYDINKACITSPDKTNWDLSIANCKFEAVAPVVDSRAIFLGGYERVNINNCQVSRVMASSSDFGTGIEISNCSDVNIGGVQIEGVQRGVVVSGDESGLAIFDNCEAAGI